MYNTALRITGDELLTEDVLQDAFVSAFKNISNYRGEASFGSWLKRIVINKSLNQVQKTKKDLLLIEDLTDRRIDHREENNDESTFTIEGVKSAMKGLPSGFRSVISLYLFEGYDHKEISEILGISESTSKSQYKRAKDKLKSILIERKNYG